MFWLDFMSDYKVIHITNELGSCMEGGARTYINELYRHRNSETVEEQQKILLKNLQRFSAGKMAGEYEKLWAELL